METTRQADFWVTLPEPTDDDVVVELRLHRYNQGLPCGASVLRRCLQEEIGPGRPVPSMRTINRILARQGLTHRRTGWYEGDALSEKEQRLMSGADHYRNFSNGAWSYDPHSPGGQGPMEIVEHRSF